eukprot:scaffold5194_cov118-Cylindrotheca_fusiformis.AAC.2
MSSRRRSSRVALSNQSNTVSNFFMPPSKKKKQAAGGSTAASSSSSSKRKLQNNTTTSAKKKSKHGLLGFVATKDRNQEYPVKVGSILGRNPKKKIAGHVDMKITDMRIPKRFLQVTKVTSDSIELKAYINDNDDKQAAQRVLFVVSNCVHIQRKNKKTISSMDADAAKKPIRLHEGDVLRLTSYQNSNNCRFHYQFQIAPMSSILAPVDKKSSSSTAAAAAATTTAATKPPSQPPTKSQTYRPTFSMGHKVPNFKPPPPPSSTKTVVSHESKSPKNRTVPQAPQDSDSEDDDDDGDFNDEEERASGSQKRNPTMNGTYSTTFWKALNTNTPHLGSTVLTTLAKQHQAPTPDLLVHLVKLFTFGPTFQHDHFFYEGNRMQLAWEYLEHCQGSIRQLRQAATQVGDGDYWKLVLDQLHVLMYVSPHTTATATPDQSEEELKQSFYLQSFSLRLLLRLLQQHDDDDDDDAWISQDDMERVLFHVAQTMAHVWVRHGHHFLEATSIGSALEPVTSQLTQLLGWVAAATAGKQQQTTSKKKKKKKKTTTATTTTTTKLVDVLWNAMDGQFQNALALHQTKAKERKQVLFLFVCQLEDLVVDSEKQNHQVQWETVVQQLVQRAGLSKEYKKLSLY